MLILPIENRPDWSKPPLITIALILVNVLVFILYQGDDQETVEQAASYYREHQILEQDRKHYLDYLNTEAPRELKDQFDQLESAGRTNHRDEMLRWEIMFDRKFDRYLERRWETGAIADTDSNRAWRQHRQRFEQLRNRLSSFNGGLVPAQADPITFLTSQFLHGGWDHLIGNMIFLFLFGFTLEAVLKSYVYLLMYLASGVAASALHLVLNADSMIPVIGASGAISGLMGMYLALYRLRKIRFFYNFLFYFGELRAPALLILPLWLAKELYGHFYIDSSTAYWAHIGGLLAGAVLMFAVPQRQQSFERELKAQDQNLELEKGLAGVQQSLTQLDMTRARNQCRLLCQKHPADPRPWQQMFELHKAQPKQKPFHQTTFELLKQFLRQKDNWTHWNSCVQEVLAEYQTLAPSMPALNGSMSLALARHYWQQRHAEESEKYLERALDKGATQDNMKKLIQEMLLHYQQRRDTHRAARLTKLLAQLEIQTPTTPQN